MKLRFNTLISVLLPELKIVKKTIVLLTLVICCPIYSQNVSIDDIKKDANKLFEEEEFTKAYKLYAQLVANYPKDPEYNFKLGVCMIYSEPDKKKCLPYLIFANSKADEAPKEVKFYLGKAYHINYQFDEAIKYYNEYKKVGSSSKQKKLMVDREIMSCGYGKRLLSNLSDLEVKSKKQLNEADYFRSYDLKNIGGKLLIKPETFRTASDKKKKEKSVVYLPRAADKVFFSSYGETTDNKDIYYAIKLANGEFAKPVKLNGINTDYDEDYPFLHPNGKTLYFASKGHNGMGGYDIFKSNYIEATDSWTQPENLEFPINSPDDDYLYVTDSLEKVAYFSTGRQSPPGKIDVLKINTERKVIDILALKGTVVKENAEQSLKSKITVKNMGNGEIVGVFEAQDNGDYLMNLPNGAKLLYTVETPGLKTQSERVGLPFATNSRPLKQTISYDKGILKIINYFDETPTDESYLQYLTLIEKKSKLDVNEGQNNLGASTSDNAISLNTSTNTVTSNNKNTPTIENSEQDTTSKVAITNTKTVNTPSNTSSIKSVSTKELVDIAKQDANDSKKEADQLTQDSWDAEQVGEQKKIEATTKLKEADEILKNAQSITNEDEKNKETERGNSIKTEGENELAVANKIINFSNTLKEDAANKQKEAILNEKYAAELEKININKNKDNKESLAKLDELQKEIAKLSNKESSSENLYNSIKNDIEQKEKEIAAIEKTKATTDSNIEGIKSEITNTEIELSKTKKKKEKEILNAQIEKEKAELIEKEKLVEQNQEEIKKLNDELASLKSELELTNKIKTETIATAKTNSITNTATNPAENTSAIKSNTTSVATSQKITDKVLENKYKDKIAVLDINNPSSIEESTKEIKNYNKEIDLAISTNKKELLKAKTPAAKQQITNEIKQLEGSKKDNNQLIAANNKQLQTLNQEITKNNTANNTIEKPINLSPITAKNSNDAIKNLDELSKQLNSNDNANFEYNAYQNTDAQKLKIEADAKINEAFIQQKKLKDLITITKEEVQNSNSESNPNEVTPTELYIEAEELLNKAQKLKNDAQTKTGDEKVKLLSEAKSFEEKGNSKNIQAAEIVKADNTAIYNVNLANIKTLIDANKASENEVTKAKTLNDEATTAFKQASAIREESNSLTNIGAKLGGLSNAEEKEAWALAKQKEAIELLKDSNPTTVLKTAITSTSTIKVVKEDNAVNTKLTTVNASLNELAKTKTDAYQKMYEANVLELEQLDSNLKENETLISNTPSLKSESIASNNKINSAKALKQKSDSTTNSNDKLNELIAATKKQIEAINQINTLNKKVGSQIANNKAKENTVPKDNAIATTNTNTNSTKDNSAINNNATKDNATTKNNTTNDNATTKNNSATNNNTTKDNATAKTNSTTNTTVAENNFTNAIDTKTVDINELSKTDTTAAQVINYFENKTSTLKNPQANSLKNKAINELKINDTENKAIELEINNYKDKNPSSNLTSKDLKTKADELLIQAEELSNKAFELKNKANNASGAEKENLISEANQLENQSQDKKIESSNLSQQSNEIDYKTNNVAISELLTKLENDNPTLTSELEQKNSEVALLKSQAQKLREEANAQSNLSAKLGALGNVEEKEAEFLIKQNQIITELKKQYPDYVVKPFVNDNNTSNTNLPSNLVQKQKQIQDKQATELTNLTNALSLEYETTKMYVPKNLNNDQELVKQNAENLNSESKRLLIKATQEPNPKEKAKLLTLAAKSGNAANEQLNKIIGNKVVTNNNTKNNTNVALNTNPKNNSNTTKNTNPKNNTNSTATNTENNTNATAKNTTKNNTEDTNNPSVNNAKGTVKIEGLEIVSKNAYSDEKPIPLDSKMPDGLIFRVQIGAFKTQLPNDAFKGLSPLNGETVGNGYIRYTAGNFIKFENADAVKNDLRNLGYSDAFVVGYFNGKRITVAEAIALLNKEGKTINSNAPTTAGITANSNIPNINSNVTQPTINSQEVVNVTKELEKINGLLFTVQIGVYNKQVRKGQLKNLGPIFSERLPSGLYRYTAGIYNDTERLLTDKRKVVDLGISDAFVSAYLNGKRITFADAKDKKANDPTVKLETQNPIIFPEGGAINKTPETNTPATNNTPAVNTSTVQAFKNDVTNYPAATAENGVKATEEGVSFKVQIGAYSKQIPNDVAARFSAIKNWPIENKQINSLFIYNIGNFTDAKFAKSLKEQAVSIGISDAFITVYKDGKKVYGAEAAALLNR
ncbi:MAG: hypothetical protein Q8T03_14375 [Bacteroidota bacterium]|nr:hypothetical protein [Bacteroidota bacterium]